MAVNLPGGSGVVTDQASPRQSYTAALTVLTSVFFIWGFATVLNDTLVPHFKSAFGLNYAQSPLLESVFYLGYLIMGLPAAKVLERTGYKLAVVLGLLGMAASAAAFVPAAILESYDMFLVALFLLAGSITLLQVAANPYVTVIGSPQTASSRLNLVQAFNSLGTTLAPLFGGYLIFGRSASGTVHGAVTLTAQQRAGTSTPWSCPSPDRLRAARARIARLARAATGSRQRRRAAPRAPSGRTTACGGIATWCSAFRPSCST